MRHAGPRWSMLVEIVIGAISRINEDILRPRDTKGDEQKNIGFDSFRRKETGV